MNHRTKRMATFFLAFALLATTLVSILPAATSVGKANAASSDNQPASQYFGVSADAIVAELSAHEGDGYYLGTPYRDINTSFTDAQNRALCLSPNGDPTSEGPGMNCTGFVAYVIQKCGGDIARVLNNSDPIPTGVANAINWRRALMGDENVEYYKYDSVADLLSSGIAQKGDMIYCNPTSWEISGHEGNTYPTEDCHIGFFWGNSPSDNKFWHSSAPDGNRISAITPKTEPSVYYLIKVRPGEIEIRKESKNKAVTQNNDCYSLAGAVYGIFRAGDGAKVGEITLDAAGKGSKKGLANGSYYVQETKPPANGSYQLDTTKYPVTIAGNKKTVTLQLSDPPTILTDPVAVLLYKADAETLKYDPQGDGTLAGAQFTIKYYDGYYTASNLPGSATRTWVFETDEDGIVAFDARAKVGGDALYTDNATGDLTIPLGTVTVQETKAPTGYNLNDKLFVQQITADSKGGLIKVYNTVETTDIPIRGGLRIEKWDNERDVKNPQGDASLQDAVFEVYNRSAAPVRVAGVDYAKNALVYTMTTGAGGVAQTPARLLPYGTYEVIEKTPPKGYLATGVIKQTFQIRTDGQVVNLNTSDTAIKNDIIRGALRIEKWDSERDAKNPQGDSTLKDTVFEIYNRSAAPVRVDGVDYAKDALVYTIATDASGVAQTPARFLPFGTYEVIEKTPPKGYLASGMLKRTFQIETDGQVVNYNTKDTAIKNDVIRGDVHVEKWDNELDSYDLDAHKAQGGATLEGAVFQILNRSAHAVRVGGSWFEPGKVVHTLITDEKGEASTTGRLLPYGSYELVEVTPPEGYLATGVLVRSFQIRVDGEVVQLNTSSTAIKNNPKRGDMEGVKISEDMGRLSNVPFRITSRTTGENHVIITDANGYFNTSSAWNPHSQDTNRGETEYDGIWFGELEILDDSLGALLYDTYILEELPCKANADLELIEPFEVRVYRHGAVVKLGTLTDKYTPQPEIGTTALDKASGTRSAQPGKTTTILDTVRYDGLEAGKEYHIQGVLMDRATGEPLLVGGKEVTASKTFIAADASGSVELSFTFDSSALKGKVVVVFETLYRDKTEIAVHADISDFDQTVAFDVPLISTTALDKDSGTHSAQVGRATTIVDSVQYAGLEVGKEYRIEGVLMDKATGKPLLIDGKQVTAGATFTAESADGTVDVEFTFDSTGLEGRAVVVFERLTQDDIEVAIHTDIDDEGQTVTFEVPEIGTTALDKATSTHSARTDKTTTIVDTVQYTGLKAGQEYNIKGILMDKATGKPLLVDGKQVTASKTFIAEGTRGSVELSFTFDSSALKGKVVVVFEALYLDKVEIAVHADIQDFEQSVAFEVPHIGTTARDSATGTNSAVVSKKTTIIDTVQYTGLQVNKEYMVTGVLMDKTTGEALLIKGKQVTASATFVTRGTDGSVELEFTFDSSALVGKDVVVFEKLFAGKEEIAAHEDIEDKGQTIAFEDEPEPYTPPTCHNAPRTGDGAPIALLVVGAMVATAGVILIIRYKRKHKMAK